MNKKEFLKLYKGKAVWCKTEELANEFLELADGFGFRWGIENKIKKESDFVRSEEKTCYYIINKNILTYYHLNWVKNNNYKIIEFKSLKSNSTPQVIFDPPKTILTLNGKKFVSIAKDEQFDKEKGVLMCLAKANGFDYEKVSELVASAKKQMPKLTNAERVILENLPKEYKWITRDEDDDIFIYKNKPRKLPQFNEWRDISSGILRRLEVFNHLFQFIKWSDDEPYEISKLLEEK